MPDLKLDTLLEPVLTIAHGAGERILEIYAQPFEVHDKSDGSPVTVADQAAHEFICAELAKLTPNCPVLSEESSDAVKQARLEWQEFWLVDPLDGTKEFIHKNGEFTVNIALIRNRQPVLGVVTTPARGIAHFAAEGFGAFKREQDDTRPIRCRALDLSNPVLVASRSHAGEAVDKYRAAMEKKLGEITTMSMGSALKICLVAEGSADIYPRLGYTSEWDTAASHCVLNEAGGRLINLEGEELPYNKPESLLNSWFLALGDPAHDWLGYLET